MIIADITRIVASVGLLSSGWLVVACSFLAALVGTVLCRKLALKFGIVDKPDNLVKTHKKPVAYLGGIGILIGLVVGVMAGVFLLAGEEYFSDAFKWLVGVSLGGAVVCAVGVVDDIIDIRPWQKIIGQLLAAAALVVVGIRPGLGDMAAVLDWTISENVEIVLAIPVVIIFVLGATNSLNLLDGIDGLCGSVSGIIAVGMLGLAIFFGAGHVDDAGSQVRVIISLALIGAVCGFLPFNRQPAKIFMGDAGSMLLGFVIAAIMILFAAESVKFWMASIVVFGLPILDTAVAFARRWLNKRPFFVSDRGHIYDQMMDRGASVKKTVALCCGIGVVYALVAVLGSWMAIGYAAILYVLTVLVSAVAVWKKGYLKMEGLRGAGRDDEKSSQ